MRIPLDYRESPDYRPIGECADCHVKTEGLKFRCRRCEVIARSHRVKERRERTLEETMTPRVIKLMRVVQKRQRLNMERLRREA